MLLKSLLTIQAALGASQACPSYLLQLVICTIFPFFYPHGGFVATVSETQYHFDSFSPQTCTRTSILPEISKAVPGREANERGKQARFGPGRLPHHGKMTFISKLDQPIRASGENKTIVHRHRVGLASPKPLQARLGQGQTKRPLNCLAPTSILF
jgi:hypothetical protein